MMPRACMLAGLRPILNDPLFDIVVVCPYGHRRDKPCPRGFRQSDAQISLLSYRDWLENTTFACSKYRYDAFQNN